MSVPQNNDDLTLSQRASRCAALVPGKFGFKLASQQMACRSRTDRRRADLLRRFQTSHHLQQNSVSPALRMALASCAQPALARRWPKTFSQLENHHRARRRGWRPVGMFRAIRQPAAAREISSQAARPRGFSSAQGNVKWTLLALVGTWTLAAFGEEMVYRGYLMNRVADLFNRTRPAWIISLIAVHVGFGLAHAYQGWTGIIDEGLMGLLLGIIYLRTGRNLSVPIIAHGIGDTIDFLLIFLGKYPGM